MLLVSLSASLVSVSLLLPTLSTLKVELCTVLLMLSFSHIVRIASKLAPLCSITVLAVGASFLDVSSLEKALEVKSKPCWFKYFLTSCRAVEEVSVSAIVLRNMGLILLDRSRGHRCVDGRDNSQVFQVVAELPLADYLGVDHVEVDFARPS